MQISIKRRFLAYALAVAVMIGASAFYPQRTNAEAVTATAAVVATVASVMTACGVSYWAASQQDAILYLGQKLDNYFYDLGQMYSSPLDWLGVSTITDVFSIMSGGKLRLPMAIANKILDFVDWFNQTEGVESNGNPVGDLGGYEEPYSLFQQDSGATGSINGVTLDSDTFRITSTNLHSNSWNLQSKYWIGVIVPENSTVHFSTSNITGDWTNVNFGYYIANYQGDFASVCKSATANKSAGTAFSTDYFISSGYNMLILIFRAAPTGNAISGSLDLTISNIDMEKDPTVIVQPTDSVILPTALEQGQSLVVSTSAPITDSDTVEEAVQAILDTVVSQNGLTSTSITEGAAVPSAWTWLYDVVRGIGNTLSDIKDAILGIPSSILGGISTALQAAFVPSQAYIDTFVASLYSTFDNHFSILSYPFSLLGTFITRISTSSSTQPIFSWPNIYEPFSNKLIIPAGSYNLNSALENQSIKYAYDLYMIVVKGIIAFEFVAFLYAWFCDVFHMRNDDFAAPSRDDGSDDVDDDDDDDISYNSWSAW